MNDDLVEKTLQFGNPERTTDQVRQVVAAAIDRAELEGVPFGTDHLLREIAMPGGAASIATLMLKQLFGPEIASGKAANDLNAPPPSFVTDWSEIERVFQSAKQWAASVNHLGTEHLLIGLACSGTRSAATLKQWGIEPDNMRQLLLKAMRIGSDDHDID